VVPAWNLGKELATCLDSVRMQTPRPRILVVDNASEDSLATGDAEVLRLERRTSVGAARNHGLAAVRTPLAAFIDGDDVLLPGALAHLVSHVYSSDDVVAADGAILLWDPGRHTRSPSYYPPLWTRRMRSRPRLFAGIALLVSALPTAGPMVMRTEAAREVGGFADGDFLETWPLGAALAARGRVVRSERPCKLYRTVAGRESLKVKGQRQLAARYRGRTAVRRRIRGLGGVPATLRVLAWTLAPAVHAFAAISDSAQPRFVRDQRRRRLADRHPAALEVADEPQLHPQARNAREHRQEPFPG
jgi:hypothetical protein